jgi:hypothetical protein
MSKGAYDVFSLVMNFIGVNWKPKCVMIVGLFETTKRNSQVMALKLQALLDKYDLRKKILAYVKDKGVNLGALTTILKCVINCEDFGG